jgi:hypothetical protein
LISAHFSKECEFSGRAWVCRDLWALTSRAPRLAVALLVLLAVLLR